MYNYGMATGAVPTIVTGGNNDGGWGGSNGILGLLALLGVFRGGYGGIGGNGGGAVADSVVLNPAFQSLENQISNVQSQINTNGITDAVSDINTSLNSISLAQAAAFRDFSTQLANANFTTLNSINGLGSAVTATMNQNQLANLNSFNQQNVSFLQGINTLSNQNQNATNQIIAGQNAQNATMAQCCCEIKGAIHSDGEETRALINSLNVQNLQSQLNDAKNQISDLNQTNTLIANNASQTQTILTHLIPFLAPTAATPTTTPSK